MAVSQRVPPDVKLGPPPDLERPRDPDLGLLERWRAGDGAAGQVLFELRDLGVKLLIDPKSLAYIDGTQLDFVREGLNEGFKFNNPNERDRCGCGESFRV